MGPKALKKIKRITSLFPKKDEESRKAQVVTQTSQMSHLMSSLKTELVTKLHEKAESWESSQLQSASAIPSGAKQRARIPE